MVWFDFFCDFCQNRTEPNCYIVIKLVAVLKWNRSNPDRKLFLLKYYAFYIIFIIKKDDLINQRKTLTWDHSQAHPVWYEVGAHTKEKEPCRDKAYLAKVITQYFTKRLASTHNIIQQTLYWITILIWKEEEKFNVWLKRKTLTVKCFERKTFLFIFFFKRYWGRKNRT